MKIYYAMILDHLGNEILPLKYTATNKHSAYLATEYVKDCPPAQGFKIRVMFIDNSTVADLMNRKRD